MNRIYKTLRIISLIILIILMSLSLYKKCFADELEGWPVVWEINYQVSNEYGVQNYTVTETLHSSDMDTFVAGLISSGAVATNGTTCTTAAAGSSLAAVGLVAGLTAIIGLEVYVIAHEIDSLYCQAYTGATTMRAKGWRVQHPITSDTWEFEERGSIYGDRHPGLPICLGVDKVYTVHIPAYSENPNNNNTSVTVDSVYVNYNDPICGVIGNHQYWTGLIQKEVDTDLADSGWSVAVDDQTGYNTQAVRTYDINLPDSDDVAAYLKLHPELLSQSKINPEIGPMPLGPTIELPAPDTDVSTGDGTDTGTDPSTDPDTDPSTDTDDDDDEDDDTSGSVTGAQPNIPDLNTSIETPTKSDIGNLISEWLSNAPFISAFREIHIEASGSCIIQISNPLGPPAEMNFCKFESVWSAINVILTSIAYILAAIIVVRV